MNVNNQILSFHVSSLSNSSSSFLVWSASNYKLALITAFVHQQFLQQFKPSFPFNLSYCLAAFDSVFIRGPSPTPKSSLLHANSHIHQNFKSIKPRSLVAPLCRLYVLMLIILVLLLQPVLPLAMVLYHHWFEASLFSTFA